MTKRKDIFNNEFEVECIGCAITNKTLIPIGGIIKETENFILIHDPEIPIKGFLIITSKRHLKSITELSKPEALEFFSLCHEARIALSTFDDVLECSLIQEERSGHFHFWILPRFSWTNELFESSLSAVRPILKYAKENMKTSQNISEIEDCVRRLKVLLAQERRTHKAFSVITHNLPLFLKG